MTKYYNIAHIFIIYTFSLVLLYGLFCYILLITMYRYNYLPGLALFVSGIVIFASGSIIYTLPWLFLT